MNRLASRIASIIDLLQPYYPWGKVAVNLYPAKTPSDTTDLPKYVSKFVSVERLSDSKALLAAIASGPADVKSVLVENIRSRAKDQFYDINWYLEWQCRDPLDPKELHARGLAPSDAVARICIRCNDRILGLSEAERAELCRKALMLFTQMTKAYFGFITCESLKDTQGGDFYGSQFVVPCYNIRREAMSYWATFPEEERRRRVPAVFWGNYYSGELLEAVQKKCPTFFERIATWTATDLILPGPRPWPHIVEKMGSGMFWTLSVDPLYDSRSDFGLGTVYGGRMLDLNLFARRLLSEAGIHI